MFKLIAMIQFSLENVASMINMFTRQTMTSYNEGAEQKGRELKGEHSDQVGSRSQRMTLKELPMTKPTPLL